MAATRPFRWELQVMGRRESPIDAEGGPVAEFAAGLRRLREQAGSPTYRQLGERTRFAPSVLSAAARGTRLATWPVTRAFVAACGGDVVLWHRRWREVSEAVHPAVAGAAAGPGWIPGRSIRPIRSRGTCRPTPARSPAGSRNCGICSPRPTNWELTDAHSTGTVVITAIDGMAGIGKTALALRAGHLLADRFPDGQLFVDLHGYTQGLPARDPADALTVLLRSLGLPPDRIPEDLDARAAVYRARLAGTRTLILLDNAADEAQVRPLLPASSTCLVLVTSRKRLRALDSTR
jgi:hypothetical protein